MNWEFVIMCLFKDLDTSLVVIEQSPLLSNAMGLIPKAVQLNLWILQCSIFDLDQTCAEYKILLFAWILEVVSSYS